MTIETLPTFEQMRAAVQNRPFPVKLKTIAEDCNVSVAWLKKVINGEIKEPSIVKMLCVYNYIKTK